jgi:hypothetical protein
VSEPKRLLPQSAYDFWAIDHRDGEEGPRRATLAAARKDARAMRKIARRSPNLFFGFLIQVEWEMNEAKVLRLLRLARNRRKP